MYMIMRNWNVSSTTEKFALHPFIFTRSLKSLAQNEAEINNRAQSKYEYVIWSLGRPVQTLEPSKVPPNVQQRKSAPS